MIDSTELDRPTLAKAIACRRWGMPVGSTGLRTLEPGDGSVTVSCDGRPSIRVTPRELRAVKARQRVAQLTAPARDDWRAVPDPNDPKGHVLLSSPAADKLVRLSVADATALIRALLSVDTIADSATR